MDTRYLLILYGKEPDGWKDAPQTVVEDIDDLTAAFVKTLYTAAEVLAQHPEPLYIRVVELDDDDDNPLPGWTPAAYVDIAYIDPARGAVDLIRKVVSGNPGPDLKDFLDDLAAVDKW